MQNKTTKAKVRLLMPFQGWCLDGRGIHKHYNLFKLFEAIRQKNFYNAQRTKCFCRYCDNELCGSKSHRRSVRTEKGAFEVYECSNCKQINTFQFDTPVPILVDNIH